MKKKNFILPVLAITLVLASGIQASMAYFTTYASAKGGYTIELEKETRVKEDVSDWTKHVSITCDEDSKPVYIRVRAYCGNEYTLTYSDESGKWSPSADGFYYYRDIMTANESTDILDVHISGIPEEAKSSDDFNVVVVFECTPVLYDADGNPYADWNKKVETKTVRGGEES